MKQKIMIRVPTNGQKSCAKAMMIVVSLQGVESATLKGDDKGQIEIIGESVDPVELTSKLRRKMGQADLVSVSEIKIEEKKEKPPEKVAQDPPYVWVYPSGPYGGGYVYPEPTTQGYQDPSCCIM